MGLKTCHRNDWMKCIDDNTSISKLSLLGSHDTGTGCKWKHYNLIGKLFTFIARCQDISICEQLNIGVRYLDIRLKKENNKLHNYHGLARTNLSFKDILKTCDNFLSLNPSEFLIMRIKREDYGKSKNKKVTDSEFLDSFLSEIEEYKDIFIISDKPLAVKEARGKIVLMSFEANEHNFIFPPQYGFVDFQQPADDMSCFKQYLNIVKVDLDSTSWEEDIICLIQCNSIGSLPIFEKIPLLKKIPWPRRSARKINRMLKEYYKTSKVKNCILLCDFVDTELADIIIKSNF